MLQLDLSRIFFERSLTMICWVIFGRIFVSLCFFFLFPFVSHVSFLVDVSNKCANLRIVGRLNVCCARIDCFLYVSILYVADNATMQFLWGNQNPTNRSTSFQSQRYHASLIDFHPRIDIGISETRVSSDISDIDRQWSFQLKIIGAEIVLANSYLNPPPTSLPRQGFREALQRSFVAACKVPRYRRNRTSKDRRFRFRLILRSRRGRGNGRTERKRVVGKRTRRNQARVRSISSMYFLRHHAHNQMILFDWRNDRGQ